MPSSYFRLYYQKSVCSSLFSHVSYMLCVLILLDLIILIILGEEQKLWAHTENNSWNIIYRFNWISNWGEREIYRNISPKKVNILVGIHIYYSGFWTNEWNTVW
jgi:hypothetical protein